ncbi:MAG: alanine--tRNA ligase [Proteobacteria bacterium]|jgi:alanyl-tRNA synthetase|nr:alanine--tRNA ligase [Pseudomonadota bacterium]
MKSNEVRGQFLEYFKKQGHEVLPSSSLIPENDPTLLFANAGMNQFKNLFLGLEHKPFKRAATSQKCVRAGGKHNDLENVGFTARHHTFFEMLGNFSFGDYFKKDAIHFAWELLTKVYGIPKEKLYVTVFQTDDEAADIWHQQEGVPKERIFRLGEKDNFWRMGDTGPCGPCTEIFYDHGPRAGRETDPFKGILAGEDRFVEIWNLVFMQFYEKSPGVMDPLPKPSVDTGSGLERLTAALQGKLNNYDTDLFWPMVVRTAELAKKESLLKVIEQIDKEGVHAQISPSIREEVAALRVVADHIRSGSFLIADGALPSNEGRGYVLRRILRRSIRYFQKLSGGDSFLPQVSEILIREMSGQYPELNARKDVVLSTLKDEQDRFMQTLGTGTSILNESLAKLKSQNQKQVPGDLVFKLYDTYGFPADLTRLMAEEQGFSVDEKQFDKEMEAAKEKAKASWKGKGISSNEAHLVALAQKAKDQSSATNFTGYKTTDDLAEVLLLSDGEKEVSSLRAGQTGFAILKSTPFYAEGGGQAGDQGLLIADGTEVQVVDCTKQLDIHLHQLSLQKGEIKVGQKLKATVHSKDRRNTAANHSATHLLHSALRKVLGTHVTQAGQMVDPQRIRFDFTHNKPLTNSELEQIESLINEEIAKAVPVTANIMKHKEALAAGAMALFGEKYGDEVRVLKMGDFSTELCGGTHVQNTAEIRIFKIVSESGVSAGVRRIEAITGDLAVQYLFKNLTENQRARHQAGLGENWVTYLESTKDMSQWIEEKKTEIKNLEREMKKAQGGQINLDALVQSSHLFKSKAGDAKFVFADLKVEDRDVLAQATDQLKDKVRTGVVVVLGQGSSTHPLIVAVSKDLNPEVSAGNLLKELAAVMGGKGGGRPDFAQGAIPDRSKSQEALKKAKELLNIQ